MPARKDGGKGAAPKPKVRPKSSVGAAITDAGKKKPAGKWMAPQRPPQQRSTNAGVGGKSKGTVKVKKKKSGVERAVSEGVKRALDLSPVGPAIRGTKAVGKAERVAEPVIPKPVKQAAKIVDKGLSGDYVLKPAARLAKGMVEAGAPAIGKSMAATAGGPTKVGAGGTKRLAAKPAVTVTDKQAKAAAEPLKRVTDDAIDLLANAVPAVYVPGREVARGKPGSAAKMLAEPFVETAKHPKKSFLEHPLQTTLLASGVARGGSMGAGKALRTLPSKTTREYASTKREAKTAEGLPLRVERKHPKGIVGNRISKARDRRKPAPEPTTKDLQHAADIHVGVQQDMARIHRAKTAEATTKALRDPVTPTRRPRKGRIKQKDENVAATSVAAQGIASRAELPGLLVKAKAAERRMRDEIAVAKDKDAAAQIQLRLDENLRNQAIIEKAIKKGNAGTDTAAGRYAGVNVKLQEGLGARQIVEPGRGERARLIPYAVAKMDGKWDPQLGLVTKDGSPLSNEAIRAHMAENGVKDPAYVTHAPGQGGNKNYGLGTSRTGKPTPSISPVPRTGKAVSDVTIPLGKNTLMESNQKAQGLIDAHDAHADMVREVGFHVKDKETGKPVLVQRDKYDGPGGIQELVQQQNAKGGVQYRAVRLTVFADQRAHLKQIVDDARTSPEQIDLHVNDALRDALKPSESNPGTGPWTMIPDAFAQRVMQHLDLSNNTTVGKGLQAVTSQSRKVVLVTNPKWLAGNVIEPLIVRAPIGHVGPRSKMTQMTFMDELAKTQPSKAEMLHSAAMGGGNVSLTSRMAVKQTVDRYRGTGLEPVAKGLHVVLETPGPKQIAALWNAGTHFVFDRLNGTFEREVQGAFLGKALRDHPLLTDQGVRLSNEAIRQAAHGKVDLGLIVRLSDEVKRGFGQYDMFGPSTRWMVQNLTPFVPWYLNALKFCLSVLPKDHPVATSLLVAANQATDDWRKLHGQKMSVTGGGAPSYLQGSVPGKDGTYLRMSRYTPMGAFQDPLGTAAQSVLSLASGVLNTAEGIDWKNSPLNPGRESTLAERGLAVLAAGGDVTVPGFSQIRRLIQGRTVRQVLDPFVYTSPSKGGRPKVRSKDPWGKAASKSSPDPWGGGTSSSSSKSSDPWGG